MLNSFEMDEPDLIWPAWKFGMKIGDQFTVLHDQYNTFSLSLQDPEAFHHDISEASHRAGSNHEFHDLLTDRKKQRVQELTESLERASLEIIANPTLISTTQWQHAVQLFRTGSFDSLVRYFTSYLSGDGYQLDRSMYPDSRSIIHSTEEGASGLGQDIDIAVLPPSAQRLYSLALHKYTKDQVEALFRTTRSIPAASTRDLRHPDGRETESVSNDNDQ
jgi:hypothetical protein